ncbi:metallophosphoesterase [Bacteroidota bacterium]
MFFFYILSAYFIPAIYVYFRIIYLLIPKGRKIIFTLVFLLLISAFPVTELLLHEETSTFFIPLARFGYYTMPYMLYLFLLVLLFDIFLLLNLFIQWLPKGYIRSASFRKTGLISAIIIPCLVVIYGIFNFNHIRTSEYSINVPGKSSTLQNLKIAFVSDFHIGDMTSQKFVERFVHKMKEIQPDIIFFGGDILEGDREDIRMSRIEELFNELDAKYGIHGVYGNHEHHGRRSSISFYNNTGISILQDTVILIDHSFYLGGRKDSRNRDRLSIDDLITDLLDHYPIILMDHRPGDIQAVSQTKVDIQLSGHTHHGQLFPFNFITSDIYEISWGHEIIGNTHFFVTSGIQLWGPPVRTVGKSEITVINVRFIQ